MSRPVTPARKLRVVKIDEDLRERLRNALNSMVNIVMERRDSEIEFNSFIEALWNFDGIADELEALDKAQNGVEE